VVGHIERFNPVTSELDKILSSEEILSIDVHRLSPFDARIFDTDVALDLMIHDIDLLSNFIRDDISDIKSQGINVYSNTFDYVQTLIKYSSGKLASLTASRITEDKKRTVEINTKSAYIVADYLNRTITITRKTKFSLDVGYATKYKQENIQEKVFVPMKEPLFAELEHFHECISTRAVPKTSIINSLNVLKTCKEVVDKIGR
jgi:predicted dehydrogenase